MMLTFFFASSEVNRESNFRMFVRESASHPSSLILEEQRVSQVISVSHFFAKCDKLKCCRCCSSFKLLHREEARRETDLVFWRAAPVCSRVVGNVHATFPSSGLASRLLHDFQVLLHFVVCSCHKPTHQFWLRKVNA